MKKKKFWRAFRIMNRTLSWKEINHLKCLWSGDHPNVRHAQDGVEEFLEPLHVITMNEPGRVVVHAKRSTIGFVVPLEVVHQKLIHLVYVPGIVAGCQTKYRKNDKNLHEERILISLEQFGLLEGLPSAMAHRYPRRSSQCTSGTSHRPG